LKVGVSLLDLLQIGKKLTELRQKKEYTQDDLAELLFVSHQAVSKWERGMTLPSIDNFCFLMELYSASLEELLCLETKSNESDVNLLFQEHNRQYVIHEVVLNRMQGVSLDKIIHILSEQERLYALYLLIEHKQPISKILWPRLSLEERQMIIHKHIESKIELDLNELGCMMTSNEIRKIKEIENGIN
jgi:transcriptional regulator with XRE-family HTH domain